MGVLSPALLPLAAIGQQSAAAAVPPASDSVSVIRREVFTYPAGPRRDPFMPLNAGEQVGPRFEDLELSGIIYSPDAGSVAVLVDRATQRRYRVRGGDRLGAAEVVEIRPGEAVFLVSAFGVSRREILRVKKREKERGG